MNNLGLLFMTGRPGVLIDEGYPYVFSRAIDEEACRDAMVNLALPLETGCDDVRSNREQAV